MKRCLLALALFPLAVSAQLQLLVAPKGGAETSVTGVYDIGSVAVAESSSVRFRLRNVGQASVTLTYLYVAGAGFTMTGAPSMPFVVASGVNVDFTINFIPLNSGSFSANLQVNGTGYLLRGTGLPGVTVRLGRDDLPTGSDIDFGRVERGESSRASLALMNTTTDPVLVESLQVSGVGFAVASGIPSFPMTLQPGVSVPFVVVYSPAVSGIATGSLTVDRRSFRLTGTAYEPTIPRPTVLIESGAIRSGQQGRVSVRLSAVSKAYAKGQLRLELRPSGQIRDNDGAAMFTAGSRTLQFDISPGDEVVKLRGDTSAVFQAGTTAGTIVLIAEAGGFTEQAVVTIAPEPVKVDKAAAARSGTGIEVTVAGFDNTRSLNELAFTFYFEGQPMAGMPIRTTVGPDFLPWWASSTLGGIFQVRAAFPVSGDASKITSVEVTMTSSAGKTTTERISF